jgi:hypothetical protein
MPSVKVRLIAVLPVPLAIPAKATASRLPTIREPMVYGSVGVRSPIAQRDAIALCPPQTSR